MLASPQYLGNTFLKHPNIWETRYKLCIMINLRGVCHYISGKVYMYVRNDEMTLRRKAGRREIGVEKLENENFSKIGNSENNMARQISGYGNEMILGPLPNPSLSPCNYVITYM